jgi:hypothetical protein
MALLRQGIVGLLFTLVRGTMPALAAEPPPAVQAEVNFLLGAIGTSGCRFQRNGDWHSAHDAQQHLRDKYEYLVARDRIDTTEQFIERVATKSSFSGQFYLVDCVGEPTLTSRQWLHHKLAQLRGPG